MTPTQKKMLVSIAEGGDPNLIVQLATAVGGQQAHNTARTILALYRSGMLQTSRGGGLEISDKGRAACRAKKPAVSS